MSERLGRLCSCEAVEAGKADGVGIRRLRDEADTFVKDNEEMRGIINFGHKRDGKVLRIVGEAMEPRAFNTFCPMVIAAVGRLPVTIEGRSVIIGPAPFRCEVLFLHLTRFEPFLW